MLGRLPPGLAALLLVLPGPVTACLGRTETRSEESIRTSLAAADPRSIDTVTSERPDDPDSDRQGPQAVRLGPALVEDLKDLATSPLRARKKDWIRAGIALGIVGAAHLMDERIRDSLDPAHPAGLAEALRPMGNESGLILMAGAWLAGRATDNRRAVSIGRDGLYASFLAAGVIVPLLKQISGRARPRAEMGDTEFQSSSGHSFPSGEVTQAFALAAVVSAHSRRKWVKAIAWTLASAMAWQRLEVDAHWASDVAAGALLGAAVGHWVVKRNRLRGWSLEPGVSSGGATLTVRKNF